ncbi:MAG: hypothetical protein IJ344_01830, partial [Clostridia bacterium]|nr:hypothetical protein [Clostridia bacterium]
MFKKYTLFCHNASKKVKVPSPGFALTQYIQKQCASIIETHCFLIKLTAQIRFFDLGAGGKLCTCTAEHHSA